MAFLNHIRSYSVLTVSAGLLLMLFLSYTPETRLLNIIPVNSVEMQVLNQHWTTF